MTLEPVREALLSDARQDAAQLRQAAEREAGATVAAAREEAGRLRATARADGEAEARAAAAAELARARRDARHSVLAARRDAYERARACAERAASALRDAPRYAALLDALSELARRQLGEDAVVVVDDEVGGFVATAGTRSVDYRLPAVADRCLVGLGPEVEALWR